MKVCFVLVEPAVPENIGAAARAIKTMGFTWLRLVNPAAHLEGKARWLAHGSADILENAQVFSDFNTAIADLDFVIATTAKKRSAKFEYHSPQAAHLFAQKKSDVIQSIGIVFGREESGLNNEEIRRCDIASSIPLANPYPSLNLAQTVMLYAYTFAEVERKNGHKQLTEGHSEEQVYRQLKDRTVAIFDTLKISDNSVLTNRIMERLATIKSDDARLFLSFAKYLNRFFE